MRNPSIALKVTISQIVTFLKTVTPFWSHADVTLMSGHSIEILPWEYRKINENFQVTLLTSIALLITWLLDAQILFVNSTVPKIWSLQLNKWNVSRARVNSCRKRSKRESIVDQSPVAPTLQYQEAQAADSAQEPQRPPILPSLWIPVKFIIEYSTRNV